MSETKGLISSLTKKWKLEYVQLWMRIYFIITFLIGLNFKTNTNKKARNREQTNGRTAKSTEEPVCSRQS